jgi:hypothetical protein
MSGCSVSALPAPSPIPFTRFNTPAGSPASWQISASSRADSGLNSAGLCTTVHPAAKAGAIFHVDSMNGVFQGVITPTGPIGWREVMFIWVGVGSDLPSRAPGARSAKNRKFSAPRSAAFDMKRQACPVSQHSQSAISSARASIRSAILCKMALRFSPLSAAHAGNAAFAAFAARSTSAADPQRHLGDQAFIDGRARLERAAASGRILATNQVQDALVAETGQMTLKPSKMSAEVRHAVPPDSLL